MILIDPGSTLNLISRRLVKKMECNVYPDSSIVMKVANGTHHRLQGYVRMSITVAGVKKIIDAYIVPNDTTYNVLLGRSWLRSTKAIGFYANDEYFIQDSIGTYHPLVDISTTQTKGPEVMLAEDVSAEEIERFQLMDEDILVDLEYSESEKIEAILKQVEEEARQQELDDDEDLEEDLEEEESGNGNRR